ncbi:MAG: AAA family ATPase [Candidatus Methanomethylicia archaeon]
MIRKIICVSGMPGAGKTSIIEPLKNRGIPVIAMGDIIREEATKRGIKPLSENLGKIMIELRKNYGPSIVAKLCLEKIALMNTDVVIIDGVRSLDEVEEYKRSFSKVLIVAVHASPVTRFKRLYSRGRQDDPKSWSEFVERDFRELSIGLGNVISLADYMIINEGSIEESRKIFEYIVRVINND